MYSERQVEIGIRQNRWICEKGDQFFKGFLMFSGPVNRLLGRQLGVFGVVPMCWNLASPWCSLKQFVNRFCNPGKILNV